jgi:Tol biopolymer transport system component
MTNVREADWSPDGSSLAVVHRVGRIDRLEYPVGNVLYESAGYLSDPRVSPDGIQVAFCEHPLAFDDRGWVKIVDRSGTVRTLAGEYSAIEGVAWMPDAQRILFSATTSGIQGYQPHVVPASASAPARVALPSMRWVIVQDVNRDGQWIAIRTEERSSIRARLPSDSGEREFSWMNDAKDAYLSVNGRILLFTDQSPSGGANYAVMYRDTSAVSPSGLVKAAPLGSRRTAPGHLPPYRVRAASCCTRWGRAIQCTCTKSQLKRLTQCAGSRTIRTSLSAVTSRQSLRAVIGRTL